LVIASFWKTACYVRRHRGERRKRGEKGGGGGGREDVKEEPIAVLGTGVEGGVNETELQRAKGLRVPSKKRSLNDLGR